MSNQKSGSSFKRYSAIIITLLVFTAGILPFGLISASAASVTFEHNERKAFTAPSTEITLTQSGYYFVEAWGTDGADGAVNEDGVKGGKGGKAVREKGLFHFNAGTTIYVQAGTKPNGAVGGTGTYFGNGGDGNKLESIINLTTATGGKGGGGGAASGILVGGTNPSNIYLASGGGGGGGGMGGDFIFGIIFPVTIKSDPAGDGGKGNVESPGGHKNNGSGWSYSYTGGRTNSESVFFEFGFSGPGGGGGGGGGYDAENNGGGGAYGANGRSVNLFGLASLDLTAASGGGGVGGKNYNGKGKTANDEVAKKLKTPINNQPKSVGGLVYITMLLEDGVSGFVNNVPAYMDDMVLLASYTADNQLIDLRYEYVEEDISGYDEDGEPIYNYSTYSSPIDDLNVTNAAKVKLFILEDFDNMYPWESAINLTKVGNIWSNDWNTK